jgi:hypothetical protein
MLDPERNDPPNKVLIDAVLDGLKHGVVFLVDSEIENDDVKRLVKKTEKLALGALLDQFGQDLSSKFFTHSENIWILRTTFGGWVFFYPIEALTPDMSMDGMGQPDFVYWPNAKGQYERVPWLYWAEMRRRGSAWRPTSTSPDPRSIWERLRDPL